jgi:hypothetical protein
MQGTKLARTWQVGQLSEVPLLIEFAVPPVGPHPSDFLFDVVDFKLHLIYHVQQLVVLLTYCLVPAHGLLGRVALGIFDNSFDLSFGLLDSREDVICGILASFRRPLVQVPLFLVGHGHKEMTGALEPLSSGDMVDCFLELLVLIKALPLLWPVDTDGF